MTMLAHTGALDASLMAACGVLIYIGSRRFVVAVAALIQERRDKIVP